MDLPSPSKLKNHGGDFSRQSRSHRLFDSMGTYHQRRNPHKNHVFQYKFGHFCEKPEYPTHQGASSKHLESKSARHSTQPSESNWSPRSSSLGMLVSGEKGQLASLPRAKWLQDAQKVLRFHCLLLNNNPDQELTSLYTKPMLRKCTLLYYLVDGCWELQESKVENSGYFGGFLIKKTKAALPFTEVRVGQQLEIGGLHILIEDCDQFTRSVMPDQPAAMRASSTPERNGPRSPRPDVFRQERIQQELRSRSRRPVPAPGVQLTFFAKWDNRNQINGEEHFYKLSFFPADSTMEVREMGLNGYNQYPVLLKRQKVRKDVLSVHVNGIGEDPSGSEYVVLQDLEVGSTIKIQGREMVVCAATRPTYEWFKQNCFIDMQVNEQPLPAYITDQMDGYHPQSSRAVSIFGKLSSPKKQSGVGPKTRTSPAPRDKFLQRAQLEGQCLRAAAETRKRGRYRSQDTKQFVIKYYLADNTMAVYYNAEPNAGDIGGSFMARQEVTNPTTQRPYQPWELLVGASLRIVGTTMEVVGLDHYSLQYLEAKRFPENDPQAILKKLYGQQDLLRDWQGQPMPKESFLAVLQDLGVNLSSLLTEHETFVLLDKLKRMTPQDSFSPQDLAQAIENQEFPLSSEENPFEAKKELEAIVKMVHGIELSGKQEVEFRQALAKLTVALQQRSVLPQVFLASGGQQAPAEPRKVGEALVNVVGLTLREAEMVRIKFFSTNLIETKNLTNEKLIHIIEEYIALRNKGFLLG